VRVAVAEDSLLLREVVTRLLTGGGFDVVGRWDNSEDLLMRVRSDPPDVVRPRIPETRPLLRPVRTVSTAHPRWDVGCDQSD
jgi:hypothetical protein